MPGEMFQLLLESQSSGVHRALAGKILARTALYNLVLPALEKGLGAGWLWAVFVHSHGWPLSACMLGVVLWLHMQPRLTRSWLRQPCTTWCCPLWTRAWGRSVSCLYVSIQRALLSACLLGLVSQPHRQRNVARIGGAHTT